GGVQGGVAADLRRGPEAAAAARPRHGRRQRVLPPHAQAVRRAVPRGQGVRVAATAGPDAHGPRPGGDAAAGRSVRARVSEAPGQAEGEGGPLSEYSADRGRERLAEVGGG